jgi:hypothetical protein
MNNDKNKSLGDNILNAIKKGEVKMRPKWHFILRGVLLGIGTALVVLTLLYIASFILFVLHQTGVWFLPSFGFQGLGLLFFSLPWILILIAAIFIFILELLVRQYSFAYRRPLLYSALGVIFLVLIGGFILAQTDLHPHFYRDARARRLPFGGELYRGYGSKPPRDIHPCMITEMTESEFKCQEPDDDIVTITITPDTTFPGGTDFMVNDKVLVIGPRQGNTITAHGITKIENMMVPRNNASSTRMHIRVYKPQ